MVNLCNERHDMATSAIGQQTADQLLDPGIQPMINTGTNVLLVVATPSYN